MLKVANSHLYNKFRKEFPEFIYDSYHVEISSSHVSMEFCFRLGDRFTFKPNAQFPIDGNPGAALRLQQHPELLNNLAFNIGMIELLSYWKCVCSPIITVRPAALTPDQTEWWKTLYFNGMGEFFYINSIDADPETFVTIVSESENHFTAQHFDADEGILIPIGGGKDSIVTLELLKRHFKDVVPLIMNPRGATIDTVKTAGYRMDQVMTIRRNLDPLLLKLNDEGFLNGHTPFSAMLAFYTLTAALISGHRHIALSNEASANEATIPGTHINHQYSKSFEFEAGFRKYYTAYISPDLNYFSFLRPLSELQIAKIFSTLSEYHTIFRSCNIGSKTDSWCGKCAKCMFTAIILSPFSGIKETAQFLGHDMFNDPEMMKIFNELSGIAENKPFECVGTIDEVNTALQMLLNSTKEEELPLLLKHYASSITSKAFSPDFSVMNPEHFVATPLLNLLKEALK